MLEMTLQNILFLICVGVFTIAAAVCDHRSRRIPNQLTVSFFALGLVFQLCFNGWSGAEEAGIAEGGLRGSLLAFSVGFGTLFVLWMIGGGGGGDVKLMGALSVWLGFQLTLYVMVASTLFVLAGTLAVLTWNMITRGPMRAKRKFSAAEKPKKDKKPAKKETVAERQKRRVMAYAIPVALATWVVLIWNLPQL